MPIGFEILAFPGNSLGPGTLRPFLNVWTKEGIK